MRPSCVSRARHPSTGELSLPAGVLAVGGRWLGENGETRRGCQQESGIPEHLVTGSQENMSCRPKLFIPLLSLSGPQRHPLTHTPYTTGPLFLAPPPQPPSPKDQAFSVGEKKKK